MTYNFESALIRSAEEYSEKISSLYSFLPDFNPEEYIFLHYNMLHFSHFIMFDVASFANSYPLKSVILNCLSWQKFLPVEVFINETPHILSEHLTSNELKITYQTYLMKSGNYYKIGRSQNPQKRLDQLRCGNPNISLIATCKEDIEELLHEQYSDKRADREWFFLNLDDVAEIEEKFKAYGKVSTEETLSFEEL